MKELPSSLIILHALYQRWGLPTSMIADMTKKRGYSDEFPTTGKTSRYLLDYIPSALWRKARAKAKREGLSMRTLILRLLSEWVSPSDSR